jgi:hypothetical protein
MYNKYYLGLGKKHFLALLAFEQSYLLDSYGAQQALRAVEGGGWFFHLSEKTFQFLKEKKQAGSYFFRRELLHNYGACCTNI